VHVSKLDLRSLTGFVRARSTGNTFGRRCEVFWKYEIVMRWLVMGLWKAEWTVTRCDEISCSQDENEMAIL
jgi:hypothetical protein